MLNIRPSSLKEDGYHAEYFIPQQVPAVVAKISVFKQMWVGDEVDHTVASLNIGEEFEGVPRNRPTLF